MFSLRQRLLNWSVFPLCIWSSLFGSYSVNCYLCTRMKLNHLLSSFSTQRMHQLQQQVEQLKEENFTMETCELKKIIRKFTEMNGKIMKKSLSLPFKAQLQFLCILKIMQWKRFLLHNEIWNSKGIQSSARYKNIQS